MIGGLKIIHDIFLLFNSGKDKSKWQKHFPGVSYLLLRWVLQHLFID